MGIRITKAVGYGITDLQMDGPNIKDPRIKEDLWEDLCEEVYALKEEDKVALFLKERDLLISLFQKVSLKDEKRAGFFFDELLYFYKHRTKKEARKDQPTVLHAEHTTTNVLLFIPVDTPDWYRYDNTLDWIEDSALHEQRNRVVELETPPWPYQEWTLHGETVNPGWGKPEGARPLIPMSCLATLIMYKKAFVDIEAFALQLKPLFYVDWG